MPKAEGEVETSVLQGARTACYKAKDTFFACVEQQNISFTVGSPVPAACRKQRAAFEEACRASWVKHFDALRDKEVRLVLTLHNNINRSATSAAGTLAGKDEGTSSF